MHLFEQVAQQTTTVYMMRNQRTIYKYYDDTWKSVKFI